MTEEMRQHGGSKRRVRVEFGPGHGATEQTRSDASSTEMAARSRQAVETAFDQVREMVERVSGLDDEMPANFKQMQVDFGIKFDWEAGALLAYKLSEASITVKLTWDRDSGPDSVGGSALAEELPLAGTEVPITPTGLIQAIEVQSHEVSE